MVPAITTLLAAVIAGLFALAAGNDTGNTSSTAASQQKESLPSSTTRPRPKFNKSVEDSSSAMDLYQFLEDQTGQIVSLDVAFELDIATWKNADEKDVQNELRIRVNCERVGKGRKQELCQQLLGDGPYFTLDIYHPSLGIEDPLRGEEGVAAILTGCFRVTGPRGEYGNAVYIKPIDPEKCID